MTSEIVIMNKEAIAMAADSAVTLTGEKIFTSANKIFRLSKYHPLGVMIYGSPYFMGIPWETIIKIYRDSLAEQVFDTFEEYAGDFIEFLSSNNLFSSETPKGRFLRRHLQAFLTINILEQQEQNDGESPREEYRKEDIYSQIQKNIQDLEDALDGSDYYPNANETVECELKEVYKKEIEETICEVFKDTDLPDNLYERIFNCALKIFIKDKYIFPEFTGIVIAGFGKRDIFPSCISFKIEGLVGNILKYSREDLDQINYDSNASIRPYAQREVVDMFLRGMHPHYSEYLVIEIDSLHDVIDLFLSKIMNIEDEQREELKTKIDLTKKEYLKVFHEREIQYSKSHHISPILSIVATLPRDELAAMAESLINLTSFKRKMSTDAETVGGPIDVAVISKMDGFIWVKRKRYYDLELNPLKYKI